MLGLLLGGPGIPGHPIVSPRIRVVPQNPGGLLQDLEESKDGTRLVTHDRGQAPRLWDAKRQIVLCVLSGHPDDVANVAFSANGTRVVTRSPQKITVWDSVRAKRLATLNAPPGDAFASSGTSPNGETLVIGTTKGAVWLGKASEISKAVKIGAHTKGVGSVAFSKDGKRFFTGSDDGTGRVWTTASGQPGWSVTGHQKSIAWADFSSTGLLATTEYDRKKAGHQIGSVLVWSPTGQRVARYAHTIGARGVDLTWSGAVFVGKTGSELLTFDASGTMPIHRVGTEKPVRSLVGHAGSIREIRFSPDRQYVSTVAEDDALFMWDTVAGKSIPFDPGSGTYTAGDFSPNRPVFWLGYENGDVRQFDLKTGKSTQETFGAVANLERVEIANGGRSLLLKVPAKTIGFGIAEQGQRIALDPTGGHGSTAYPFTLEEDSVSPDGQYLAMRDRSLKYPFAVVDLWTQEIKIGLEKERSFAWSTDGALVATLDGDSGHVEVFDLKNRKSLKAWQWPTDKEWGAMEGLTFHPNGQWLVTAHHPGSEIKLWDWETGKQVQSLGTNKDLIQKTRFSADGKRFFTLGLASIVAVDTESGKTLWTHKNTFSSLDNWQWSADGTRILVRHGYKEPVLVLNGTTGAELFRADTQSKSALSADGKRLVTATKNQVTLWNVDTKQKLKTIELDAAPTELSFFADRLISIDSVRGMGVWSADGTRLATVVAMKDGSWLAYDDEGRYDATDPSNVKGAYYVLEWANGLEPIAMPQLKGQFYEPQLLAKALGISKDALRTVPDLSSVRLFPEVEVKRSGEKVTIAARERDEGGIGTIRVSINGKEVLKKKGAGFLSVDLAALSNYFLPEVRLPKGDENVLTVTVSNETGDLTSPPATLGLGFPGDLKAPEVHLYGLCVGIGDYAGDGGDLKAPPSDALAIAQALRETGERLLPKKVEITELVTGSNGEGPTRANVLKWLKETGEKATSSDIVFIFVAGHGVSRIGDQAGYFMLTQEADPSDVSPATATTAAISGEELRQALATIPAGKQVVVLDTCHSGAASGALLGAGRSVSGDYQRAWEAIKDTTGTWLLAGAAADQLSYKSTNVDHGMLSYALLEAIDKGSAEGLRKAPSGELFVDVERWLGYAANRVESLKSEVGISGVQRPEFKRSTKGESFDLGVMSEAKRGFLTLKPPMPIVIVGDFQMDEEDPLEFEAKVAAAMRDAKSIKAWFEVAKHPGVYRATGTYTVNGDAVKLKVLIQRFDERQQRKTLETFELEGTKSDLKSLAESTRSELEKRIRNLEAAPTRGAASGA